MRLCSSMKERLAASAPSIVGHGEPQHQPATVTAAIARAMA